MSTCTRAGRLTTASTTVLWVFIRMSSVFTWSWSTDLELEERYKWSAFFHEGTHSQTLIHAEVTQAEEPVPSSLQHDSTLIVFGRTGVVCVGEHPSPRLTGTGFCSEDKNAVGQHAKHDAIHTKPAGSEWWLLPLTLTTAD